MESRFGAIAVWEVLRAQAHKCSFSDSFSRR